MDMSGLMNLSNKELVLRDERGNEIYIRCYNEDGEDYDEAWFEYDENNNMTYFKSSYGDEEWSIYNKHNQIINFVDQDGIQDWYEYNKYDHVHVKSSNGEECWYRRDNDGGAVHITEEEFKEGKDEI